MDRLVPEFTSTREALQSAFHNKELGVAGIAALANEASTNSAELLVEVIALALDRPRFASPSPDIDKPSSAHALQPGFRSASTDHFNCLVNRPGIEKFAGVLDCCRYKSLVNVINSPNVFDIWRTTHTQHFENGQQFRDAVISSPLQATYQKMKSFPYHLIGTMPTRLTLAAAVLQSAFGPEARENFNDPSTLGGSIPRDEVPALAHLDNWLMTSPRSTVEFIHGATQHDTNELGWTSDLHGVFERFATVNGIFNTLTRSVEAFDAIFGDDAPAINLIHPESPHDIPWARPATTFPQIPTAVKRDFASEKDLPIPNILRHLSNVGKFRAELAAANQRLADLETEKVSIMEKKNATAADESDTTTNATDDNEYVAQLTQIDADIDYYKRVVFVYDEFTTQSRTMFIYFIQRFRLPLLSPLQLAACYAVANILGEKEIVGLLQEFGIDNDNWLNYTPAMRLENMDDPDDEYLWFYPPDATAHDFLPNQNKSGYEQIRAYSKHEVICLVVSTLGMCSPEASTTIMNMAITNQFTAHPELFQTAIELFAAEEKKLQDKVGVTPGPDAVTPDDEKDPKVEGEEVVVVAATTESETTQTETTTPQISLEQFLFPSHSTTLTALGFDFSIFSPLESTMSMTNGDIVDCSNVEPDWAVGALYGFDSTNLDHLIDKVLPILHPQGQIPFDLWNTCLTRRIMIAPLHQLAAFIECRLGALKRIEERQKLQKEIAAAQKKAASTTTKAGAKSTGTKSTAAAAKKPTSIVNAFKSRGANPGKMAYNSLINKAFALSSSPSWLGPRAPAQGKELTTIMNAMVKLAANTTKVSIIESGAFSIATNRTAYLDALSTQFQSQMMAYKYPLDPTVSTMDKNLTNKLLVALAKPVSKAFSLMPSVPEDQLTPVLDFIQLTVLNNYIDAAEGLLLAFKDVMIKSSVESRSKLINMTRLVGHSAFDWRDFIQIPDIDALLYNDDDIKDDDNEQQQKQLPAQFSRYRTNHLLRFLPHNTTTRLLFPQFYNYAPQPPQQSDSDNQPRLLFNINTPEALSKLPPPVFSLLHSALDYTTYALNSNAVPLNLVREIIERNAEDNEEATAALEAQLRINPSEFAETAAQLRINEFGANPHDLDIYSYRFVLPQHRSGTYSVKNSLDPQYYEEHEPVHKSLLSCSYPTILSLSTSSNSSEFIQPNDQTNGIEYSSPYQLTTWEGYSLERDPTYPVFRTTFTQDTLTPTHYRPQYQIELLNVAETDGDDVDRVDTTGKAKQHRGIRYLNKLTKMNNNLPKSQQSPILRFLSALKRHLFNDDDDKFLDFVENDITTFNTGNGVAATPLWTVISTNLKPNANTASLTSRATQLHLASEFAQNPLRRALYARDLSIDFLIQVVGVNGGDCDDHYYNFPTPQPAGKKIDFTKAVLIKPSEEFALMPYQKDLQKKMEDAKDGKVVEWECLDQNMAPEDLIAPTYYYNTPGMVCSLSKVLNKFHTWVESRHDIIEYLQQRDEYFRQCSEAKICPFVSLLDFTRGGIFTSSKDKLNPIDLDWDSLCRPKACASIDDDEQEQEEGQEEGQEPEPAQEVEEEEQQQPPEIKQQHPFISLSKSTPSWFAWSLEQFLSSPFISCLNEPNSDPTQNLFGRACGTSPLEQFAKEDKLQQWDPIPADDRIWDFNHNQFSIINASLFVLTETIAMQHKMIFQRYIIPTIVKYHREILPKAAARSVVDKDGQDQFPIDTPHLDTSRFHNLTPLDLSYFVYISQHFHHIPESTTPPPLPPFFQLVGENCDEKRQDYCRRARYIPHTIIRTLTCDVMTKYFGELVDLVDLFMWQNDGLPFPISTCRSVLSYNSFGQPSFMGGHVHMIMILAATLLLYSPPQSAVIQGLEEYRVQSMLEAFAQISEKSQKLQDEADQQEASRDLWSKVAVAVGALGLTAVIGGAVAYFLSLQNDDGEEDGDNKSDQQRQ